VKFVISGLLAVSLLASALAASADDSKTKAPPDTLVMLEKAVRNDSTKFDNLYKLGLAYIDRDRPQDAVKVLTKATVLRPGDVKALVNLGAAYDAQGSTGAAQDAYRKALDLAPGDSVASCRLASSLYAQGKQGEAVDLLRDLMLEKPRAHCAYFTMGVAFADAGIYREAIRMWQKVIEIAPESPEAGSAKESIDVLKKFVGM